MEFKTKSVETDPGYIMINDVRTGDKVTTLNYSYYSQLLNVTLLTPIERDERYSLWISFYVKITSDIDYRLNIIGGAIEERVASCDQSSCSI